MKNKEIKVDYCKEFGYGFKERNKVKKLTIPVVVKSLPQDNFCEVCNLPTDGKKCYSKRCPI